MRALVRGAVAGAALCAAAVCAAVAGEARGWAPRPPPALAPLLRGPVDAAALGRGAPRAQLIAAFAFEGPARARPLRARPAFRHCLVVADVAHGNRSGPSNQLLAVVRLAVLARDLLGCRLAEPALGRPTRWGAPAVPASALLETDGGAWALADGTPLFVGRDEGLRLGLHPAWLPPPPATADGPPPGRPAAAEDPPPGIACAITPTIALLTPPADYPPAIRCSSATAAWDRPGWDADLLADARRTHAPGGLAVVGVPVPMFFHTAFAPDDPAAARPVWHLNAAPEHPRSVLAPRPFLRDLARAWLANLTGLAVPPSRGGGPCPDLPYAAVHSRAAPSYAQLCAEIPEVPCGTTTAASALAASQLACRHPLVLIGSDTPSGLARAALAAASALCPSPARIVDLPSQHHPSILPFLRGLVPAPPLLAAGPRDAEALALYSATQLLMACADEFAGTARSTFSERVRGLRGWLGKGGVAELPPLRFGGPDGG